jgi:hypothetical protein
MIIAAAVFRRCNCVKVVLVDFLTPTNAVTENPQNYFAAEILLTQPVGMATKSTTAANYI